MPPLCWRQTPAMVMAFLKPNEDGSPPELGKDARIALQHFPGPLKYPYMHQFLTAFAGMLGCAQCAACQERSSILCSSCMHALQQTGFSKCVQSPLRLSVIQKTFLYTCKGRSRAALPSTWSVTMATSSGQRFSCSFT